MDIFENFEELVIREPQDSTISLVIEGTEVMHIDAEGIISFPNPKPADELAAEVIGILEGSLVKMYCAQCSLEGRD